LKAVPHWVASSSFLLALNLLTLFSDNPHEVIRGRSPVLDPKNWTLPLGVELKTKNEVQDAKETKEL
jgi:hypothetical protein